MNQIQPSKEELLRQTVDKFKIFLTDDLQIDDEQLNSNQGLYEQLTQVKNYKPLISIIGQDKVTGYVQNIIVNYFNLKNITPDQKQKLNDFIDFAIELTV